MITIERNRIESSSGKAYIFLYNQFDKEFHRIVDRNGMHNGVIQYEFYMEYSGSEEFFAIAKNKNNEKDIIKYQLSKKEIKEFIKERKDIEVWSKLNKCPY